MKTVFADTYYYLALLNKRDQGHVKATELASESDLIVITTEWVLTELGDALSAPNQRPRFLSLLDVLYEDLDTQIVESSHDLFLSGVSLYSRRPDKSWSLTDCTSFVVMKKRGLVEALTADRHFEQAGYVPLLV